MTNVRPIEYAHMDAWEADMLRMHQASFEEPTDRALLQFTEGETPEFVLNYLRTAIEAGSLFSDIQNIGPMRLRQLRRLFKETLEQEGWTIDDVADNLMQFEPSLTRQEAQTIARTETASVVNSAREIAYERRGDMADARFYWSGVLDGRTTQACEWLIKQTNPFHNGTPVGFDELKDMIEEAPRHDPDMQNDIARPEDWVVHPNERKTFVRYREGMEEYL